MNKAIKTGKLQKAMKQHYETRTIDITPTWEGLLPVMIQVLRNPDANLDSIREIKGELMRLAKFADNAKKSNQ